MACVGQSDADCPSEVDETDCRALTSSPSVSKLTGEFGGLPARAMTDNKKPAELFRTDLISAMKLPDTDQLQPEEYYFISDTWKMEWEKGVQVPVKSDAVHKPSFRMLLEKPKTCDFKLPVRKYLHSSQDDDYKQGTHELTGMHQLAEQIVRYDLDDVDVQWLQRCNEERSELGFEEIHEWNMEKIMEELENQCHEKMQETIKTSEGLGIEFDENIICDVCRSPESEDGNEMVFCDACDICVHQACYGIQTIPEGTWLCRTCALGIQPPCIFCPKTGGAMKSTRSGTKWSHVSCALWIPEVSIGCVEKMEPVTKISNIPASRWALVCCICRERIGACIQCSVKSCKIAFHVTCGFQNSLEMNTILEENENDVKLKAYCPKHTRRKNGGDSSDNLNKDAPLTPSKLDTMTKEERENLRQEKIKELEDEFYRVIKVRDVAYTLQLDSDAVDLVYNYWMLKRKSNFNKPLLTPKMEEADMLSKQQEDCLIARMKMFVHLRQDLERVRNLCYMVSRREKIRKQLYKFKEDIFNKQLEVINKERLTMRETRSIVDLNSAKDIYDQPEFIKLKAMNTGFVSRLENNRTPVLDLNTPSHAPKNESLKPDSNLECEIIEVGDYEHNEHSPTSLMNSSDSKNIFDIVNSYALSPRRSSRGSNSALKSKSESDTDDNQLCNQDELESTTIRSDAVIENSEECLADDEEEDIVIVHVSPPKTVPGKHSSSNVVVNGSRRTFNKLSLKSRIRNKYHRPKKQILMSSLRRSQTNLEKFFKPITQNPSLCEKLGISKNMKSHSSNLKSGPNGDVYIENKEPNEYFERSRRLSTRLSSGSVDQSLLTPSTRRGVKRKLASEIDSLTNCLPDPDFTSRNNIPDSDQRIGQNNLNLKQFQNCNNLISSECNGSVGSEQDVSGDDSDSSAGPKLRKRLRRSEISDNDSVTGSNTRSSRSRLLPS